MATEQIEAKYRIKCDNCGLEALYTLDGRSTLTDAEEHWKEIKWLSYQGRQFCSEKCKDEWKDKLGALFKPRRDDE